MGVELADPDGTPNDALAAYYAERARGGAGIVIAGYTATASPHSAAGPNQLSLADPRQIPKWARLVQAVQREGSLLFVELAHAGLQRPSLLGGPAWGPSLPTEPGPGRASPETLDAAGIAAVIEGFARSARWARQAGADGVELHAAHGYLLHEFLSPRNNRRADGWGGDRPGRMRLVREVVQAVRAEIGSAVLGVRLNGWDGLPGGLTPREGEGLALDLAGDGAVDYLSLSAGGPGSEWRASSIAPYLVEPGAIWQYAARVRRGLKIPVVAVGSIATTEQAERVLADGVDLVAVGRSFLADAAWGRKAIAGDAVGIRPCIRCNRCREEENAFHEVRCTVNPHMGREGVALVRGAGHVQVAGGGPSGIMAAIAAAESGARVDLYAAGDLLGGRLRRTALLPRRHEHRRLLLHWEDRLGRLGVTVHLGRPLTPEGLVPDATVVIAAGAEVLASARPTTWDLLGQDPKGSLVVDDPSLLGVELALAWAEAGQPVYLVGEAATLAADAPVFLRRVVQALVAEAGIPLLAPHSEGWPGGARVARAPEVRPRGREAAALAAAAGARSFVVEVDDLLDAVHRGQAAGEAAARMGTS
jgi:2,4-dienoyl-CoA reductase-like NADH-dependent reductase (Old Yellow Enzyme family)